jgi:hypothetical protein
MAYQLMPKAQYGLSDIMAEISDRGMAKPNRYEVNFTVPACVQQFSVDESLSLNTTGGRYRTQNSISSRIGARLSVFCEQVSLPPTRIITTRQQIFGPPSFHPIGADYGGDNLSMTFALDKWYTVKEFFDIWVDGVVVRTGRFTGCVHYPENYMCQGLTITQLDEDDRAHYTAVFEDVFPIAINPISLGYDMTNQVTKMSVTLCYRRWRSMSMTTSNQPPSDTPRTQQVAGSRNSRGTANNNRADSNRLSSNARAALKV